MNNSTKSVLTSIILFVMITLVSLISSCGGGGGTAIIPDPNAGQNPGTPAVGTANLSGQLVQAGSSRVSSAAGDALAGLIVSLINTASGQQSAPQLTSPTGKFEFKGMPSGNQYLMKVEFTSSSDLDGDGRLDEVELYQPLSLGNQAVIDLLSKIGVTDSNGDGQLDAIELETRISDDSGMNNTLRSQHNRRSGESRSDDDGNGSFDDNPSVRDSDSDGIPDVPMIGGTISDDSGLFELEVKGSIEAISSTSITVSGQSFGLSSTTTWRIDDNRSADPALFTVGTFVEVEGRRNGSGGFMATKVKTEDGAGGTGGGSAGIEREVKGFIEAISSESITVGGVTFALTSGTTWRIGDDRSASPGEFSVGMFVEVEGPSNGQGGYTATKVKTEDDFGGSGGDDDSNDDNGGDDNGGDDDSGSDDGPGDDNGGDDDSGSDDGPGDDNGGDDDSGSDDDDDSAKDDDEDDDIDDDDSNDD